jgi:hypothetical protein
MIDTVGVEVEATNIPYYSAKSLCPLGWHIDNDGSIRSHRRIVGPVEFVEMPKYLKREIDETQFGAEFVSPPTQLEGGGLEKLMAQITKLLRVLRQHGEEIDKTTSLHVHVNSGTPPLPVLKNMVWLWQALEAPFFRLSVAEHEQHRGATYNSYMYCRPISAPQVIRGTDGQFYRAFDLAKLMANAETTQQWVAAFARSDIQPNKWQPFRYYGIHWGNVFTEKQTTEFRVFNSTMHARYIQAWIELCVAFVRVAYMDRLVSNLRPFPLGNTRPEGAKQDFQFVDIQGIIPLSLISERSWTVLEELWDTADWQEGCVDQINHLVLTYDRSTAINDLPEYLRPEVVDHDYVMEELWDRFEYH